MRLIIYLLTLFLPLRVLCCDVWSIDMQVRQDSNFSPANQTYHVSIEMLVDEDSTCSIGNESFKVWTACGEAYTPTAVISSSKLVDTNRFKCFPISRFSNGVLKEYRLKGSFTLNQAQCYSILVYYQKGEKTYYNLAGHDSVKVPVSAWVDLMGLYQDTTVPLYRNKPYQPDTNISMLAGCINRSQTYQPFIMDPDNDSLGVVGTKVTWYDTSSVTYPNPQKQNYSSVFSRFFPFQSNYYSIKRKERIDFEPSDTGVFALPLKVIELRPEQVGLIDWYEMSTTYKQVPVLVNGQCYSHLANQPAFSGDTILYDCNDGFLKIPLNSMVDPRSISSDGSDLKFNNSQGYPALVNEALAADPNSSYTDTLVLDIQFLYDGFYEIQLLAGVDGNTMISECGFELTGANQVTIEAVNCPGTTGYYENGKGNLDIFPNPTQGIVRISSALPISNIVITNLSGSKISTPEYENVGKEVSINVHHFPSGIYFVRLRLADGSVSMEKLIVE